VTSHLGREIDKLKNRILIYGGMVEKALGNAVSSLNDWDMDLAREVVENDYGLDQEEVEIEEECLKILALNQPVAIDLRFVVAVLKMNNDLERIADIAVNIAERVLDLGEVGRIQHPEQVNRMLDTAQSMLRSSLDALVNMNTELAHKVIIDDDVLDDLHRSMYKIVIDNILDNPVSVQQQITLLYISRQLERIGDQVTNIAEDVIYMVNGEIVRHSI
jgi:phosphate transport system protein